MLEYLLAFTTYSCSTLALEACGINAGWWKYKDLKTTAFAMTWLMTTYGFVLFLTILLPPEWLSLAFLSAGYLLAGITMDVVGKHEGVFEELNITPLQNAMLYLARLLAAWTVFTLALV